MIKNDEGKPDFTLIPQVALQCVAKVFTLGAKKYSPYNWKNSVPGERDRKTRLIASVLRHVNAHLRGEVLDDESGLPHLAHAASTILMVLELQLEERPAEGETKWVVSVPTMWEHVPMDAPDVRNFYQHVKGVD